jgi:hypothetical protein
MKKALLTLFVVSLSFAAFSQSMPPVDNVTLVTAKDYHDVQPLVIQVSGYLLSNPVDKDDEVRLTASIFLVRWIQGTPDFNFTFGHNVMKYFNKDSELVGVYYAAISSFSLKYPSVKDSKTITLNAVKTFVAYIDNTSNHVVLTPRLKKLSDAAQSGNLESFLKL